MNIFWSILLGLCIGAVIRLQHQNDNLTARITALEQKASTPKPFIELRNP